MATGHGARGDRGRQPRHRRGRRHRPGRFAGGRRAGRGHGSARLPEWSRTDVEKRAAILAKAADLIHENAKGLAATLTSEQGKPLAEAAGEVSHLAHGVRFYAEAATKVRGAYQELPSAFGPAYGMVIRRPVGVCAAITPYNFPLTLLGTKVAPALAAGNAVVAKPAATTPLATLEVARLFAEAGVPDGVLNVVTGRGSVIGDALVGPSRCSPGGVHRLH